MFEKPAWLRPHGEPWKPGPERVAFELLGEAPARIVLGVVRCDLGPSAGVVVAEADMSLVDTIRGTLPSLANRRQDIFGSGVPGQAR